MECKKCHKEFLESEITNGVCNDCRDGVKEKAVYQRVWFWLIISIIIISIMGFFIFNSSSNNNYSNQAISILNEYKNGKTTKKEASEKIESLRERISTEYKQTNKTNLLMLETTLQQINWNLTKGEISNLDIDKYIQEIKYEKLK